MRPLEGMQAHGGSGVMRELARCACLAKARGGVILKSFCHACMVPAVSVCMMRQVVVTVTRPLPHALRAKVQGCSISRLPHILSGHKVDLPHHC